MEESGENCPSDFDLEMGADNNDNNCYDEEDKLGCDEDPIMDETQRKLKQREELQERLLALSATLPSSADFNNKEMDDKSILENASNYVKQLQQRVRELEENVGGGSNSNENNSSGEYYYYGEGGGNNITLPEIKARVLKNQVLIMIHCEKQKDLMLKILTKLENNLHLSVINNSVLPFGKSTIDIITIVAQMGDKYNMTVDELVESLRLTIC